MHLAGETFIVEESEGWVYIYHPKWSLCGCGLSREEALRDLRREMLEARELLLASTPQLSEEARAMLTWLETACTSTWDCSSPRTPGTSSAA